MPEESMVRMRAIYLEAERELSAAYDALFLERRRILRAVAILRTPGMWSDFATRAVAILEGRDEELRVPAGVPPKET